MFSVIKLVILARPLIFWDFFSCRCILINFGVFQTFLNNEQKINEELVHKDLNILLKKVMKRQYLTASTVQPFLSEHRREHRDAFVVKNCYSREMSNCFVTDLMPRCLS